MPIPPATLLARLAAHAAVVGPDAELLARFAESRDEAAFAELVRRHGPAVYLVCRRLAGPAADDAFQATFLVLATRAGSVRQTGAVGGWLVGVAGRVARQMQAASLRRRRHELSSGQTDSRRSDAGPELAEQFRIVDEELTRLPDRLRGPVVACLLQGRSQEQVAADLGGSPRTVRRRLEEAKRLLRLRLERRGVVPAVAAALAGGAGEVAIAVPPELGPRTVAAVFDFLAGGAATSTAPALIAKGVVTAMTLWKLAAFLMTAALGLTALGVGLAEGGPPAKVEPQKTVEPKPDVPPPPASPPEDRIPRLELPELLTQPPEPPLPPGPLASGHMTENFAVAAPTRELARTFGEYAEKYRREKAIEWLGAEMPTWRQRCPLTVTVSPGQAGGATTFTFGEGADGRPAVTGQEIKVSGGLDGLLHSVLPHEVTHTVLAHHFGRAVPRWADEGISVLSESDQERRVHRSRCRELLNQGRGIPLRHLFRLKEYPTDMTVLFAQGFSVCDFLMSKGGRQLILRFVAIGMQNDNRNWDEAATEVYGLDTVDALQEAWIASLHTGQVPPLPVPISTPKTRTQNGSGFAVTGASLPVARTLVSELTLQRRLMADRWGGGLVPAESELPIPVEYHADGNVTHGPAWLNVHVNEKGQTRPDRLTLSGPLTGVLESDIPQLMVRAVFIERFKTNLPSWALTGVPALEAPAAEQGALDAVARRMVGGGKAVRLAAFFADADAFSADVKAQGHSVARFLLTRKPDLHVVLFEGGSIGRLSDEEVAKLSTSPHFTAARHGLVTFLSFGANWSLAAKEVYGFRDTDALEAAWIAWLKSPASRADLPPGVANRPLPPPAPQPLIPPVNLDLQPATGSGEGGSK